MGITRGVTMGSGFVAVVIGVTVSVIAALVMLAVLYMNREPGDGVFGEDSDAREDSTIDSTPLDDGPPDDSTPIVDPPPPSPPPPPVMHFTTSDAAGNPTICSSVTQHTGTTAAPGFMVFDPDTGVGIVSGNLDTAIDLCARRPLLCAGVVGSSGPRLITNAGGVRSFVDMADSGVVQFRGYDYSGLQDNGVEGDNPGFGGGVTDLTVYKRVACPAVG
jgi:hypothetical protein